MVSVKGDSRQAIDPFGMKGIELAIKNGMNIEHLVPRISLHDFNELEGSRLWGFLNIKREEAVSQNHL